MTAAAFRQTPASRERRAASAAASRAAAGEVRHDGEGAEQLWRAAVASVAAIYGVNAGDVAASQSEGEARAARVIAYYVLRHGFAWRIDRIGRAFGRSAGSVRKHLDALPGAMAKCPHIATKARLALEETVATLRVLRGADAADAWGGGDRGAAGHLPANERIRNVTASLAFVAGFAKSEALRAAIAATPATEHKLAHASSVDSAAAVDRDG